MSRARAGLGVLAALALVALWVAWAVDRPGERPLDGPRPRTSTPNSPPELTTRKRAPNPSTPNEQPPVERPADDSGRLPMRQEGPVATYRRYAVYPPNSRPLSVEQADLIDWNRRHETTRPDPDDASLAILFTADRFHLVGAQTLSPVLDVRRDNEPVDVQIIDSHVELPDGRQMPFELAPSDGVHAGVVSPSEWELTEPARLVVRVAFDTGLGRRDARLAAHYTPDDAIPARFGTTWSDRIEGGSLRIEVPIQVETAGFYLVDANLYAGETPVGWTRFKGQLEPGVQTVGLVFFGKVITDRGLDGPYTVGQLRGALAMPERTPSTILMPPFDGAITTSAYGVGDFDAAEWDSPQKRDRLQRLKRLEARGGPRVTTPVGERVAPP